jgi:hypothetical protein
MSKNNDDRPVSEWPAIGENHWYVLAITSAILTALAIGAAFLWIFFDGFDGELDLKRAQALSPFGVALFAVVTFCTASWRGSINTRQANQAESEGRAKLLQEGAKLLSETGKPSHVLAAVATLGVLVSGPDKEYAFRAMNLLADFVEDHMSHHHFNRHREEISGVLNEGVANGANTGREFTFDCTPDYEGGYVERGDEELIYWHFIPGFKKLRYRSGAFAHDVHYQVDGLRNVAFFNVQLDGWSEITIDDRFSRCWFVDCGIRLVGSLDSLNSMQDYGFAFRRCDFSGCEFLDPAMLTIDFKKGGNFYSEANPPKLVGSLEKIAWADFLYTEAPAPILGWS